MSENNTNKPARQFINGVWIEQKTFDNGNSILKLSVLPDKFIESLKAAKPNEKGYVKLVISQRREVGKNNESHTMYVDDWVNPSQNQAASKPITKAPAKKAAPAPVDNDDSSF